MRLGAGFFGALVALVAIQGCAGVPPTAASGPPDTSVAPTAAAAPTPNPTTPTSVAGAAVSPQALAAVNLAKADLSKRVQVSPDTIPVDAVTAATWPDSALGCPRPGLLYSQVVTPGYRIILRIGAQIYEYHADRGTRVTLCSPIEP